MARAKRPPTKSGRPRARRGVTLSPTELDPSQIALAEPPPEVAPLAEAVARDGGAVLSTYREPLGAHTLLFVALPVDKVAPTAFQRDVSDTHVMRLTRAMDKTRRYLDPIIVVRHRDGGYFTPNGAHRLTAMKELGAKAILGLLVPEEKVAYQILALNIEKAHNLREKSLEVVRMYRDLAATDVKESEMSLEFEEPSFATLGFAYEQRGRLSGSAYQPVLRRIDGWLDVTLRDGVAERERRARLVLELDDAVSEAVARLKERGLTSPYLKSFVVARTNPLRFVKEKEGAEKKQPPFDETLATMARRARALDAAKIKTEDVARSGGPPVEGEG